MSHLIGNGIVLMMLAAAVALAVRSLWKTHRTGGHCSGNCGSCAGCRHCAHQK